jgi:hypothetical protein
VVGMGWNMEEVFRRAVGSSTWLYVDLPLPHEVSDMIHEVTG